MSEHNCQQNEKFLELATFTGEMREAVSNIKQDMDILFREMRDVKKCLKSIKKDIAQNFTDSKIELSNMKLKFTMIGIVGAGIFQLGIVLLKGIWK